MAKRVLRLDDDLDLDLRIRTRQGFIGRSVRSQRLPKPLRQLGARGVVVPAPAKESREAIVKGWRVTPSAQVSMGAGTRRYLNYLTHDGKGADGGEASLFTDEGREVTPDAFVKASEGDPHQFRFVLSLADHDRVDLTRFTRHFMAQVERDVGAKLDWLAAVHYDTEYRHAHILVRGRLDSGEDLYFTKHYWLHGMRYRAMELATQVLGRDGRKERAQSRQTAEALEAWVTSHAKAFRSGRWDDQPGEISSAQARELRAALGRLPQVEVEGIPWVWEWREQGDERMTCSHRWQDAQTRGQLVGHAPTVAPYIEAGNWQAMQPGHTYVCVACEEQITTPEAGWERRGERAMEFDEQGVPQPRDEWTVFRLTFPTGTQALYSSQQLVEDEINAASEIEVFHDARWELMHDGGWMLLATSERGAMVTLSVIEGDPQLAEELDARGFPEVQECDTFDQEFDHDEAPRQEGERSAEQAVSEPPSNGFTQRLREYFSRARELAHDRGHGQGMG